MDTNIISREAIRADAESAAHRFIATGVDQPNSFAGEAGEGVWLCAYRRFVEFLRDPLVEGEA